MKRTRVGQAASPDNSNIESPVTAANLEEQIRLRAYQLYEERGRQHGLAEQDWSQAEAEIIQASSALKAAA